MGFLAHLLAEVITCRCQLYTHKVKTRQRFVRKPFLLPNWMKKNMKSKEAEASILLFDHHISACSFHQGEAIIPQVLLEF